MTAISFIDIARRRKIQRIEIPILQRDYAQGREGLETARIRRAFLTALRDALVDHHSLHLDFVYGHIVDGKLVPLDGQQRLTTLFLLHWYLAARADLDPGVASTLPALTYETRYSSRRFCELIVGQRPFPLVAGASPSDWLRDQRWFASAWRYDPTIESMLVVLDELHSLFGEADCAAAWRRLVDAERPAITFDFLPVEKLGLTDDLYIKMNSRGKPLTSFENFKAAFEAMVRDSGSDRDHELCARIDNDWTDVFWHLRGDDDEIDDAFLRYFRFVTEVCGMRAGIDPVGDALNSARMVYSGSPTRLDSLFEMFDVWHGKDVRAVFDGYYTASEHQPGKVALFDDVDLLRACATTYDPAAIGKGALALWKTLVLFGVIEHLRRSTPDFAYRSRVLRNLLMNSTSELRHDALPELLGEVSELVGSGTLPTDGLNRRQLAEEEQKAMRRTAEPAVAAVLDRLEDHPLLRGCLASFDCDAPELVRRAVAFGEVFSASGGMPVARCKPALLACGDYSYSTYPGRHQFGGQSPESWREQLTRGERRSRTALAKLLDAVSAGTGTIHERLDAVTGAFLEQRETERVFDWRYYLVRYPEMRSGESGIYVTSNDGPMSFQLCMLRKTQLNSNYRDPFLWEIYLRSEARNDDEARHHRWFTGYASKQRWLDLGRGGLGVRCVDRGLLVRPPGDEALADAYDELASNFGLVDGLLAMPQVRRDGVVCDTEDRVLAGVRLVDALLSLEADS